MQGRRLPPPDLGPLESGLFERLLAAGHGRVALDLRMYGLRGRGTILERACSTNIAWDPQLENERGPWLMRLVDLVGDADAWLERLVEALPRTSVDHDARQIAQILDLIARRGDPRARRALDEERALFRFGDEDVLGPWPANNESAVAAQTPGECTPSPSVAELNAILDAGMQIEDVVQQCAFLRARIRAQELPFSEKALDLSRSAHPALRHYGGSLIRRMRDPRLRELGLRALREHGFSGSVDDLLARNLELVDIRTFEAALPDVQDLHSVHDACVVLTSFMERNPMGERWLEIASWIYDWSPSEICRTTAVDTLAELAPDPALRREWSWDASEFVREHGRP